MSPSADGDARHDARERALHLLYESEIKGESSEAVLAALPLDPDPVVVVLVGGVDANRDELDVLLGDHARNWEVDRMAALDRTILRMGAFELVHRPEVPTAVVIDEAVELAKSYSTDDSGRFVNGVLSAVASAVR